MTEINSILENLKTYKFTDELGHSLENCVDFQWLVELANPIKIYDMDGGITWIAAQDRLDALIAMAANFSYDSLNQFVTDHFSDLTGNPDFSDISALTEEQMQILMFCEDDEDGNERSGEKKLFDKS